MITVNKLLIALFIALIFLEGCTHKVEVNPSFPPATSSQPTASLAASSQPTTGNVSILPQEQKIEDWTVSMISDSSKSIMPTYVFELTNESDTKAENVVVETGSAIAKFPSIEKKQKISVGSTYSSDVKQIHVVVSWEKRDKHFQQDIQFEVKQ